MKFVYYNQAAYENNCKLNKSRGMFSLLHTPFSKSPKYIARMYPEKN